MPGVGALACCALAKGFRASHGRGAASTRPCTVRRRHKRAVHRDDCDSRTGAVAAPMLPDPRSETVPAARRLRCRKIAPLAAPVRRPREKGCLLVASPILDQTLPNGLQVILREDHDAPLASLWTWYRVGSRNEFPGVTGISHWVEHMQFKGTESLAKGEIFREVSKQGGTLNAMTSQDWTAYFETLPADRLDLSLRIEPDRMANSLFDRAE